ncbi:hypothetical protein FOCC_FOCC015105 [Frankliniella occidentalis]|nr:hypothetical protein FOCC_FOCC015105 [Frankliniella occidentalis]
MCGEHFEEEAFSNTYKRRFKTHALPFMDPSITLIADEDLDKFYTGEVQVQNLEPLENVDDPTAQLPSSRVQGAGSKERSKTRVSRKMLAAAAGVHGPLSPDAKLILKSWMDNIKGFQRLWKTCSGLGFKSLDLRRFNQDHVENLFASIRASNGSNTKPTCIQFTSALKTVIINNLSKSTASNKNCTDDNDEFLTDFHYLFDNLHDTDHPAEIVPEEPDLIREKDIVYQDIENYLSQSKFSKSFRQYFTLVCSNILSKLY